MLTGNDNEKINHITSLQDTKSRRSYIFIGSGSSPKPPRTTYLSTQIRFGPSPQNGHDELSLHLHHMPTPIVHSSRLSSSEGTKLSETKTSTYRRLIGRLIYLTNTQLDIAFVVNNLSQFIPSPTTLHQQVVFRPLRYLKGTFRTGIFFHNNHVTQLRGFNDSYWSTCP